MPFESNTFIGLSSPDYVPVIKDTEIFYGGSQMWFPESNWYSKDYILRNYGCGTIAAADLFLYLALQNEKLQTPVTTAVLQGSSPDNNQSGHQAGIPESNHESMQTGKQISYLYYDPYVRTINDNFTKTKRYIAVLGPLLASAVNSYASRYHLGLKAKWRLGLSYYDMFDMIEEMLKQDIPVILSIGPNTPKLWGKKGVPFYERKEIEYQETPEDTTPGKKPYYYQVKQSNINGHYVSVTGIIKDEITGQIMLRISSWGKQYYINYEEYRDYIEHYSGTFTSSIVQVKKSF